eukprot:CAMPEP_0114413670 /NCGR_PEP_ID=MMETSP0103-20121206/978_1 /TAXON_ID=37642 ORGANISM="Paraphysomonas imperforata, Strain PA2" /NCGR_SAMPLE_ID=MMETSP0103 /ASSEMBLY_ACC=CAM_ASM_000201 /LENGTH=70 /DNA_ID=CAMNT_0001581759 /DNA_START=212 /DNA_END=425 /DNA_ORIENTATION=+
MIFRSSSGAKEQKGSSDDFAKFSSKKEKENEETGDYEKGKSKSLGETMRADRKAVEDLDKFDERLSDEKL